MFMRDKETFHPLPAVFGKFWTFSPILIEFRKMHELKFINEMKTTLLVTRRYDSTEIVIAKLIWYHGLLSEQDRVNPNPCPREIIPKKNKILLLNILEQDRVNPNPCPREIIPQKNKILLLYTKLNQKEERSWVKKNEETNVIWTHLRCFV